MAVYFARVGDDGPVKVGTTSKLDQRLRELRGEHGKGLRFIRIAHGSYMEEHELHRQFTRVNGEWFEFEPRMLTMPLPLGDGRVALPEPANLPPPTDDERNDLAAAMYCDCAPQDAREIWRIMRGLAEEYPAYAVAVDEWLGAADRVINMRVLRFAEREDVA